MEEALKDCFQRTLKDGDQEELKRVQLELKVRLKEVEENYRAKVEQKLKDGCTKEVWDHMETITSCSSKERSTVEGDEERANQFK